MIRIDELYCNTFLPKLQEKPNHGLHWFDPFGSVKFEELCNVPPINNIPKAVRYLFWDQEPLHPELVNHTLGKFVQVFDQGQRHIITSEYASENVEYVQNTYGFIPHYYFFHGWAALDWYRGYNKTFLMTPPQERTITKTFIAPNRIVAGQRQHRLIMLYHIFKNNITNNWISCPAVCPAEGIPIQEALRPLYKRYLDIHSVFAQQTFPMDFPNESDAPMHSCWLSLFDECAESLLYLVTETVATGRRQHLTEKTFKPICLRMPFIIVGTKGSLAYLRSYGFKTFGDIWDESYDDEEDDDLRLERIASLLRSLNELPAEGKEYLFILAQKIIEHNYNHFYNGGFESILWTELTGMIDDFTN
jgi:hypothetical protein